MRAAAWGRVVGILWLIAGVTLLAFGQFLFGAVGVIAGLALATAGKSRPRTNR